MGKIDKSYFELSEHNAFQRIMFIMIIAGSFITFFMLLLLFFDNFFVNFLNGRVFNSDQVVSYTLERNEPLKHTNYFTSWAVDIYVDTPEEARYWFNPALSLFVPTLTLSVVFALAFTAILPRSIGYMSHKIEREIVNFLDKIALAKYGQPTEHEYEEIMNEIINANLQDLHDYEELWKINIDDLKTLHNALRWKNSSLFYRIIHVNDGIKFYMRSYFTSRYSNAILGMVYIGAAVLIIIIGLRGLKFIPPTQPSLVLFALGLEFSLLITYAVTLMYYPQEKDEEKETKGKQPDSLLMTNDFGSSKEIESLLRVFVKKGITKKHK